MNEDPSSTQPRTNGASDEQSLLESIRGWLRGLRRTRNGEGSLRDALEELIEEREEDEIPINPHERVLLSNILHLRNLTAYDVMVPRADIVAVEAGTGLTELVKLISEEAHSRLPVYRETLDDVIGMVHIKDVIPFWGSNRPFKLSKIVRRVLFVAPSMRVLDLLMQMRTTRIHMALVVDEFGGIDGLVTIEDLVEEIVGEIEDEHDVAEAPSIEAQPDGSFDADARARVEEFEARVGMPLLAEDEKEDIDTLGGVVFTLAGRIPSRGELIRHPSGLEFEVLDADPRRIKRLRVRNVPAAPPARSE